MKPTDASDRLANIERAVIEISSKLVEIESIVKRGKEEAPQAEQGIASQKKRPLDNVAFATGLTVMVFSTRFINIDPNVWTAAVLFLVGALCVVMSGTLRRVDQETK